MGSEAPLGHAAQRLGLQFVSAHGSLLVVVRFVVACSESVRAHKGDDSYINTVIQYAAERTVVVVPNSRGLDVDDRAAGRRLRPCAHRQTSRGVTTASMCGSGRRVTSGISFRFKMLTALERKCVHELVAPLLNHTQILHHVRLRHARAAQRLAQRALVAADLGEDALDALFQMSHRASRLLRLEVVSESAQG